MGTQEIHRQKSIHSKVKPLFGGRFNAFGLKVLSKAKLRFLAWGERRVLAVSATAVGCRWVWTPELGYTQNNFLNTRPMPLVTLPVPFAAPTVTWVDAAHDARLAYRDAHPATCDVID
jgi:hypothetical protein